MDTALPRSRQHAVITGCAGFVGAPARDKLEREPLVTVEQGLRRTIAWLPRAGGRRYGPRYLTRP